MNYTQHRFHLLEVKLSYKNSRIWNVIPSLLLLTEKCLFPISRFKRNDSCVSFHLPIFFGKWKENHTWDWIVICFTHCIPPNELLSKVLAIIFPMRNENLELSCYFSNSQQTYMLTTFFSQGFGNIGHDMPAVWKI